jgi:hypothetical protein
MALRRICANGGKGRFRLSPDSVGKAVEKLSMKAPEAGIPGLARGCTFFVL